MRSRPLVASLLALGLLAGSSTSPAGGVEHVPGTSGTCQNWNVGDSFEFQQGQTFTETVTGQLSTVRLILSDSSPVGQTPTHNFVVEIRDGSVTGNLLGTSLYVETDATGLNAAGASPFTSLNTSYFWYQFAFVNPIAVTAGSVYAIVLRQAVPSTSWQAVACAMPAGPNNPAYTDGQHSYYENATPGWTVDSTTDMPFVIGYAVPTPPSTPTPVTPVTPAYTG